MSKRLLIALGALAFVFLAVSLALFFKVRGRAGLPKSESVPEVIQEAIARTEILKVKLFFSRKNPAA